jgi:hypothetical protein
MNIRLTPPYKYLVQKPLLCGAACIQMILFRHGKWFEQEQLAKAMNFGISKESKYCFSVKLKTVKPKDGGIYMRDFTPALNKFFKKYQLNYEANSYWFGKFKDAEKIIYENLIKSNDMILNINFKPLIKKMHWLSKKANWGHFVLVSEIKNSKIKICDPSWSDPTYWWISVKDAVQAMSPKYDKITRGFIIISKK